MTLKTGELTVTSGMLLLVDASDIFTKDEWKNVLLASQASQDAPRAVLDAVSKKVDRNLFGKAQILNVRAAGALPMFQDRQTVTVYLRGVGISEM